MGEEVGASHNLVPAQTRRPDRDPRQSRLQPHAIPHFECAACSGVLDAPNALEGCPICGGPMRWTNYVAMFGQQVHERAPPKTIAGS